MTQYVANPARGCGTKQPGGFYAEGGDFSPNGTLWAWAHILGDGFVGGNNAFIKIPPRQGWFLDSAATLLKGAPLAPPQTADVHPYYEDVYYRVGSYAYWDHVGSNSYTAWEFEQETRNLGPSRRITRYMAEGMLGRLPVPIIFTHSRVPLFVNKRDAWILLELAEIAWPSMNISDLKSYATWLDDGWAIHCGGEQGRDHYFTEILNLVNIIDNWQKYNNYHDQPIWKAIRDAFKSKDIIWYEQPIGSSWITRISYVAKDDDTVDDLNMMANRGMKIINLEDES